MSFKNIAAGFVSISAIIMVSHAALATGPSKAQISAHVDASGNVLASHGVAGVTHPATGVYCVLPSSATLQTAASNGLIYPVLTIDNTGKDANAFVQFASTHNYCPPTISFSSLYLQVYTFTLDLSSPMPSFIPADAAFDLLFQ